MGISGIITKRKVASASKATAQIAVNRRITVPKSGLGLPQQFGSLPSGCVLAGNGKVKDQGSPEGEGGQKHQSDNACDERALGQQEEWIGEPERAGHRGRGGGQDNQTERRDPPLPHDRDNCGRRRKHRPRDEGGHGWDALARQHKIGGVWQDRIHPNIAEQTFPGGPGFGLPCF